MAEDDQGARTRVQRESAIKDLSAVFDKHARSLNKVAREVQLHLTSDSIDVKSVQGLSENYKSIVDSVSNVFERIVDLSEGTPPDEVKSDFKRIDIESCKFMSEVSTKIRESQGRASSSHSNSEEKSSVEKLCSQMVLGRLPTPEPAIFSGDPLQFTRWLNSFQTLITSRSIPESERIFYLDKYLSGDARECVDNFLLQSSPEAYHEALEQLHDRFGSDFVVANAYKQKLQKWPRIQNDDYAGLRKFSDYLRQVETAKIRLSSLAVLDAEHENRVLLYKIPDFCHKEWSKQVTRATMEHRSYPSFSDFCKFIRFQSEVVNNPNTFIRCSAQGSDNCSRYNHFHSNSNSDFRLHGQGRAS